MTCLYLISSQFHMRNLSLKKESLLKRADHSCIFLVSLSYYLPHGIFLIQYNYFIPGLILSLLNCFIVFSGVFYSWKKPLNDKIDFISTFLYMMCVGIVFPFSYHLYFIMNNFEFYSMIVSWIFSSFSLWIYSFQLFDFIPDIWSYHESFHISVIIGNGITGFYLTSIISKLI